MSDYNRNSAGNQGYSRGNDGELDARQVNRFAEDAFRKSAQAMQNADYDKPGKAFGMEMDAGIAAWLNSGYNLVSGFASRFIVPNVQSLALKHGGKIGLKGTALTRTAALAAFGSEVALKSGAYIGEVWSGHTDAVRERVALAKRIAPVLDDIKGKHSAGALHSVKEADNEVIYAHRKRMAKISDGENLGNWINLAINAGPNLVTNVGELGSLWQGKELKQVRKEAVLAKQKKVELGQGDDSLGGEVKNLFGVFVNTSSGQIAQRFKVSTERKLQKTLQPYSALEMILELQDQVESKADARTFQVPKSYQAPKHRPEAYSLEEYIARILIQHQKDMADISPDHTELRDALKEDLAAVAKPIAAAIRSGDMNVLSLIRLVGEGKIIKNRGRSLASPDEIQDIIAHEAPKQASYVYVDPKEHYANAPYTRQEFKEMLPHLEGEERQVIVAMMPDSVLKDAGMSERDIKAEREAIGQRYDRMIAEHVMGLNKESDEQLAAEGMAKHEIKELHEDAAKIKQKGIEAVHSMKAGPTNEHGVELLLTNWAVPQISGNKAHLGTVLSAGREALAEAANDGAYGVSEKPQGAVITGHGKQHQGRVAANEGHFQAQA